MALYLRTVTLNCSRPAHKGDYTFAVSGMGLAAPCQTCRARCQVPDSRMVHCPSGIGLICISVSQNGLFTTQNRRIHKISEAAPDDKETRTRTRTRKPKSTSP